MIKLQNKEQYLNKLFTRLEKKRVRDRIIVERTYYFIYDIVEGKVSYDYQLYGIQALEISFKNDRSDIHFTNSSPNYRKWRPAFFSSLEEEKDEYEIFSGSLEEMIEELFLNKNGIDFFEKKYRIKNISA